MYEADPAQYYWAAEDPSDPHKLVGHLNRKSEAFSRLFKSTVLAQRIIRNYRYYYNLYYQDAAESMDMELKTFGEEGEFVGLSVNQFRSIIRHLLVLVTQDNPTWDTRAVNTDPESLQQAKLGNQILDHYMVFNHCEDFFSRACEHAVILNVGYVLTEWDRTIGPEIAGDPETGQILRAGDIRLSTPYITDVVFDFTCRDPDDIEWIRVRQITNKWNLIARFPEMKEEILKECDQDKTSSEIIRDPSAQSDFEDRVITWKFWHKPTAALPMGRYVYSIGDTVLEDTDNEYGELPIDRVVESECVGNCFGYCTGNDLQAPQEGLNAEVSAIATAHKTANVGHVWVQA
ncbi:MAG: hypothetical protein LUQ69_10295, partial [Methanoregulaceae archaeon]|nr:hypothetical protein [Methanoregulaceae archaeon]